MNATRARLAKAGTLRKGYKEMTESDREEVYFTLLELLNEGVLPHGAITKVAGERGFHRSSVLRFWKRTRAKISQGISVSSAIKSEKNKCGGKLVFIPELCVEDTKKIPLCQRTTQRDLAAKLQLSKSTINRMINAQDSVFRRHFDSVFRRHSSALKPSLTDENKLARLLFALEKTGDDGLYNDLFDEVHVDEKWFFMTKDQTGYYLTSDEKNPHRTTRHKGHIVKVMFLSAVARPRFDHQKRKMFDGKIGIWPIAEQRPALRKSKNRPAGTMEWHNLTLDRNLYREFLIEKVLPAIKTKFPSRDRRQYCIKLQQDNAPLHVLPDDEIVEAKIQELRLNLVISNQPANSPDTNINDLGFFRSLQSMQLKNPSTNVNELVDAVQKAFDDYHWVQLDNSFLTLQCCFNSIIGAHGGNDYDIEHMSKESLRRNGMLPVSIKYNSPAKHWKQLTDETPSDDTNSDSDCSDSSDSYL